MKSLKMEVAMNKNIPTNFSINFIGQLNYVSDTLSKIRAQVFYKGSNRNSTYISEEFAEKLVKTLTYAPIKGIYFQSPNESDFSDHGTDSSIGKVYGFVPENHNFAWEKHLDPDGVERVYACCDVIIWTALYKEAEEIVGKSLSLELYPPSMKYEIREIDGKKYIYFLDASFLGLQILGDSIAPCFEGAGFFALYENLFSLYNEYKDLTKEIQNTKNNIKEKGGQSMKKFKINFKLSDQKKADKLFDLLNPNYNEENDWEYKMSIIDIYDSYVLCYSYEEKQYYHVNYTKNDETDEVLIGEYQKCYFEEVSEQELGFLAKLRESRKCSLNEIEGQFTELENKIQTLTENYSKLEADLSTANETIVTYSTSIENLNKDKASLIEERDSLNKYKQDLEDEKKKNLIKKYSLKLDTSIIEKIDIANYTSEALERELSFLYVQSSPSIFSLSEKEDGIGIPKEEPLSGLEAMITKYKVN